MKGILTLGLLLAALFCHSQSFELMGGKKRVFTDIQWLETFDEKMRWSLFSRTRATVDYEDNTNLFSGAYLNFTTGSGLGGTVLGRISNAGSGSDLGLHYFKAKSSIMIYALVSYELSSDKAYSWFSILRYTPSLDENWKWYASLELFSNFIESNHAFSAQRVRLGVDRNRYQFGLALNLSGSGEDYGMTDSNPGLFFRKQF